MPKSNRVGTSQVFKKKELKREAHTYKQKMVKIAFFELEKFGLKEKKRYIKEHLPGHEVVFIDEPLDEKTAKKVKECEVIACFIYSEINKKTLAQLKSVKLVATMSTGFNHIEIDDCKKQGVVACNVPAYGSNTVAEHAMGLLLTISKKLHPAIERTRKGSFDLEGLRGFDLKDKVLGIVGTGKIGRHMIKLARAFDMEVLGYDPHPKEEIAKKEGFQYVSFDELLRRSDVISLHAPATKETHHMISKENVGKIKKGCVLINTARGSLVETEAILVGLKEGIFSGCGLDVLEAECTIKEEAELLHEAFENKCDLKTLLEEHMLLQHENVYITPHSAFYTQEALLRILDTTIENIQSFIEGVPKNTITNHKRP